MLVDAECLFIILTSGAHRYAAGAGKAKYPNEINLGKFEPIRSVLESARKATCQRSVDFNYVFFCADLFLLCTG